MNRQSSSGVDVQSSLFPLTGMQDEPQVVVTLSEAPQLPLDDDDAGHAQPIGFFAGDACLHIALCDLLFVGGRRAR